MLSLKEISEALQDARLYEVCAETGLSLPTVYKLREGKSENYALSTIMTMSDYLNSLE